MQSEINDDVLLTQAVKTRSHASGSVKSIDISTNFEKITNKLRKLYSLLNSAVMDEDVTKYLPGIDKLRYQGLIYFAKTIRDPSESTYKDLQTVKLKIKLPANQYVNLNSVHLCFLFKTKKND